MTGATNDDSFFLRRLLLTNRQVLFFGKEIYFLAYNF